MAPIRFPVAFTLVALLSTQVAHSLEERDHTNAVSSRAEQRPYIETLLRKVGLGGAFDFARNVIAFIDDPEVNKRVQHLIENLRGLLTSTLQCGDRVYVDAIKSPSSAVGRAFKAVFMGQEFEMKSLADAWAHRPNLLQLAFNMPTVLKSFDLLQIEVEVAKIMEKFKQQCLVEGLDLYKKDVEYVQSQLEKRFGMKVATSLFER